MRATLLVAALAALCAGTLVHAQVLHSSEEATSENCVAMVTDLREVIVRLERELDECRVDRVKPPLLITAAEHLRRKPLATPAPTPFTPIPTTATPSAAPSASPVPTTEGVTTHSQLATAAADSANSVVIVEADVTFPASSVILVDSGNSVSVVGRSGVDGGRVAFDGAGHSQFFWVTGGTLHIAFVNLVNGTASQVEANCRPDLFKCAGGSILVQGGGTLVMRSCDVRGGGPGVSEQFGNNFQGNIMIEGDDSVGELFNVSFTDLRATYTTAFYAQGSTAEEHAIQIKLIGCSFLRNSAASANIVTIGWNYVRADIFDCIFANNDGIALLLWDSGDVQIARCVFRENSGSDSAWPGLGGAVIIVPSSDAEISISDSVFDRNVGAVALTGGALTLAAGFITLNNVSFLSNMARSAAAAFDVKPGAKVTAVNCFALANVASDLAGCFSVDSAMLTVINSKCLYQNCDCAILLPIVMWRCGGQLVIS